MAGPNRTGLGSLVSQTLLRVASETATYVPMESRGETLETHPTVLIFSAGRLSIENPFTIESIGSAKAQPSLNDLVGSSVLDAYSDQEDLVLVFSSNHRVSISLCADDFACPEAASYTPDEGPIVVFN